MRVWILFSNLTWTLHKTYRYFRYFFEIRVVDYCVSCEYAFPQTKWRSAAQLLVTPKPHSSTRLLTLTFTRPLKHPRRKKVNYRNGEITKSAKLTMYGKAVIIPVLARTICFRGMSNYRRWRLFQDKNRRTLVRLWLARIRCAQRN